MFLLKACPRCAGDLYAAMDNEFTCIQCGKEVGAQQREAIKARLDQMRRRMPARAEA